MKILKKISDAWMHFTFWLCGCGVVSNYMNELYKKTQDKRYIDKNVKKGLLKIFNKARKVTKLSSHALLFGVDFKQKDLTKEAFESFLAELRAINWLERFGFDKIIPLPAEKSTRKPDLSAMYKNKDCVVEVFCLTEEHQQQLGHLGVYENSDPDCQGSKFGRDFITQANNKKEQLDSASSQIKLLLCVVNSRPIIELNTKDEIEGHLKYLAQKLGWEGNYYFGFLTGAIVNGQSTDVISPRLH